jgi:DNA-binding FadR family transcriptional regulator
VREGLKRLEQAGLVAIQQGGATRVLDYERTAGLELLAGMIPRKDGTVDTHVARGVLELRAELAPIVARLCTQRATDETHAELSAVVSKMEAASGDLPALRRLALDFWAVMVDGTDNLALQLAFNSLANTCDGVLDQLTQVLATELGAVRDYAALSEAVMGGQAKKAATVAVRIVSRGADAIEEALTAAGAVQGAAGAEGSE